MTQLKLLVRFKKDPRLSVPQQSLKDKLHILHSYDVIASKDLEDQNFTDLILLSHLKNTYYGLEGNRNQIYYTGCVLLGYFSAGLSIFLIMPVLVEKLIFVFKLNKALEEKRFGLYGDLIRNEEDV